MAHRQFDTVPEFIHRFFMELRHGWMTYCQFDGWFKMTILRSRFRPDCLGSKGSDGLDTKCKGRFLLLGSPGQLCRLSMNRTASRSASARHIPSPPLCGCLLCFSDLGQSS